jgi:hypothetical protein
MLNLRAAPVFEKGPRRLVLLRDLGDLKAGAEVEYPAATAARLVAKGLAAPAPEPKRKK